MRGEMRPALDNFFLHHVIIRWIGEAPAKNLGIFIKINSYFFRFDDCGPFEGGSGQMSQMPPFLIRPCWDPQVIFLKLDTLC